MLSALCDSLVLTTMLAFCRAAVFVLAERIWPARAEQKRLRPGVFLDVFYMYAGVVIMTFANLSWLMALAESARRTESVGPTLSRIEQAVRGLSFPLELMVAVVVADFFGYWKHRMFHTRLLWPFHAVHHSSEDVDFLSNERMHPLETILTNVIQLAPLALLGLHPEAIGFAAIIRSTHSVYEHTNLRFSYGPLSYVFVSPRFHRWHHASDADVVDKNYANLFSFFDWIFGTYHVPPREAPDAYGIRGFPRTWWGQMVHPFRELFGRGSLTDEAR